MYYKLKCWLEFEEMLQWEWVKSSRWSAHLSFQSPLSRLAHVFLQAHVNNMLVEWTLWQWEQGEDKVFRLFSSPPLCQLSPPLWLPTFCPRHTKTWKNDLNGDFSKTMNYLKNGVSLWTYEGVGVCHDSQVTIITRPRLSFRERRIFWNISVRFERLEWCLVRRQGVECFQVWMECLAESVKEQLRLENLKKCSLKWGKCRKCWIFL